MRLLALISAVALSSGASAQAVLGVIDGAPLQQLQSIARCGDVDGDGVEDLLVVAGFEPGMVGLGAFQVWSGATLQPLSPAVPADPGASSSHKVYPAGDFDGDGRPDVMRLNERPGVVGWDVQFFTAATGVEFLRLPVTPDPAQGVSIDPVGDIDLDGFDDIHIIQRTTVTIQTYQSAIHHGPTGARIGLLSGIANGGLWRRLFGVGDLDGDGRPDLLVTERGPSWGTNPNRNSAATLRSGPPENLVVAAIAIGVGDHLRDFAHSATTITDLDGDGIRDLAVGMPGLIDVTCCEPGEVHIFLSTGVASAPILRLLGVDDGTVLSRGGFGAWLDGGGDLDGDGVTDLLVGAPGAQGQRGYVDAYKLPELTLLWRVRPQGALDDRVRRPTFLGDLDGDGRDEWAVVDPWASYGGSLAGRVWIYSGAQGRAEPFCAASPNSTGQAAELTWLGPLAAGHSEAAYEVHGAPPHSLALTFYGNEGPALPAGDGVLCLGAGLARLPTFGLDATGSGRQNVAQALGTTGQAAWTAGTTLALQTIYRDAGLLGGAGFNTTNAWRLMLLP